MRSLIRVPDTCPVWSRLLRSTANQIIMYYTGVLRAGPRAVCCTCTGVSHMEETNASRGVHVALWSNTYIVVKTQTTFYRAVRCGL